MGPTVVVDYGVSNVQSVINMCRKAGAEIVPATTADDIDRAGKVILPGVGAFDRGMARIREMNLESALRRAALERRIPVLGLCLGMQLLTQSSEEGQASGLGWIAARTRRFDAAALARASLKVPHMGWNRVTPAKADPLIDALPADPKFYFVHSYFVDCDDPSDVLLWADHGVRFAAGVRRDNLWGMQFHPEKSHKYGLALMRAFVSL